jgi:hypothetical protein
LKAHGTPDLLLLLLLSLLLLSLLLLLLLSLPPLLLLLSLPLLLLLSLPLLLLLLLLRQGGAEAAANDGLHRQRRQYNEALHCGKVGRLQTDWFVCGTAAQLS